MKVPPRRIEFGGVAITRLKMILKQWLRQR